MANPDRLTALDAAFLDLERGGAHMHVASIMVFAGEAPTHEQLVAALLKRAVAPEKQLPRPNAHESGLKRARWN